MKQALDLRELDRALAALVGSTSGQSTHGLLMEAGRIVQSSWRDNILSEGLIESGEYLESVTVEPLDADERRSRVQIGTDARDERGFPYPVALEYGTSEMPAHPVGMRAFDTTRRRVVKTVGDGLARKVKSRRGR